MAGLSQFLTMNASEMRGGEGDRVPEEVRRAAQGKPMPRNSAGIPIITTIKMVGDPQEVAGIVLACIAGAVLVGVTAYRFIKKRGTRQ